MKLNPDLEKYRVTTGEWASDERFGNNGQFQFGRGNTDLLCVVSDGLGWDHVSVSATDYRWSRKGIQRTPTWDEMCFIKDLFFEEEECVMQLHPPKSNYINQCEHCLHLWRPQTTDIPMPLPEMVGKR